MPPIVSGTEKRKRVPMSIRDGAARPNLAQLHRLIETRNCVIGVIGLGYVGLPLALAALQAGFEVVGFDSDASRLAQLKRGESGILNVPKNVIESAFESGRFSTTNDFSTLSKPDAILIAVPTPLNRNREPDLSFVENSTKAIANKLRFGQLVVLGSTSWPGTTNEIVQPLLEATGLKSGKDFYLAFSPEREDPGNSAFTTASIPKVIGADDINSMELANALYGAFIVGTVPVSSAATAEAVKLTENIFRSVNIALVNELKMIFEKMGIDVWEVIEAASTKPFGYMPFYPGPGLGGHCVPIDPFYLTWKAREFEAATPFIELAGRINSSMPSYVVDRLTNALDRHAGRGLKGSRILVIGLSYKKNVADVRESPSLKLLDLIEKGGAVVDYHDPYLKEIPRTRLYAKMAGRRSIELSVDNLSASDAVVISADHDAIDWKHVVKHSRIVVDTRNVCARTGASASNVVKA
jgi:UDP-N-acetyl-D-glucosamine dehydrogenase